MQCSAKTGIGIEEVLERIVKQIPPPQGNEDEALQALIIDSWFDNYQGVVSLVRVKNGTLRAGDKMTVMSTGQSHQIDKVGFFNPKPHETGVLHTGEVGFVIAGIKDILGAPVGDTLTTTRNPAKSPVPGFKK